MSLINSSHLFRLPVVTESGKQLGSVRALDLEVETHTVIRYYAQSSRLIPFIGGKELIIPVTSVVRITEKEMVVEDTLIRIAPRNTKKIISIPHAPEPVLQREDPT